MPVKGTWKHVGSVGVLASKRGCTRAETVAGCLRNRDRRRRGRPASGHAVPTFGPMMKMHNDLQYKHLRVSC